MNYLDGYDDEDLARLAATDAWEITFHIGGFRQARRYGYRGGVLRDDKHRRRFPGARWRGQWYPCAQRRSDPVFRLLVAERKAMTFLPGPDKKPAIETSMAENEAPAKVSLAKADVHVEQ